MNFVRRAQEEDSSSDEEDGKTQWLEIRGHKKLVHLEVQSLIAPRVPLCLATYDRGHE